MALPVLPLWTISPDWKNGILERVEWKTGVLSSRAGAEQRSKLRLSPRRTFEVDFTVTGAERQTLDIAVRDLAFKEFWLPLWHSQVKTTATRGGFVSDFPAPTTGREFIVGGAMMVLDPVNPWASWVFEIDGITSTAISITTNPLVALDKWPAGTVLIPLRRAVIADTQQQQIKRRSYNAAQSTISFRSVENDDWPPMTFTDTYLGYPVLTDKPNEREDTTTRYERIAAVFDPGYGKRLSVDAQGFATTRQDHAWLAKGATEQSRLRSLIYALKGRLVPLWLPTFTDDFTLTQTLTVGSTTMFVRENGFRYHGGPQQGRQHIQIEMTDGTRYYRRITGTQTVSSAQERLTLDSGLPVALTPDTVRHISFVVLHRLDQDAVDIQHHTDVDGATEMRVGFVSTPENRVATPWAPPTLRAAGYNPLPCGVSVCGRVSGLIYEVPFRTKKSVNSRGVAWQGFTPEMGNTYFRSAVWRSEWNSLRTTALNDSLAVAFQTSQPARDGARPTIVQQFAQTNPQNLDYDDIAPLCSDGSAVPMGIMEFHHNWKLFGALPVESFFDGGYIFAFWHPAGTITSSNATHELWTSDGLTRILELSGAHASVNVDGGVLRYMTVYNAFSEFGPIGWPSSDQLDYAYVGDDDDWYIWRVFGA